MIIASLEHYLIKAEVFEQKKGHLRYVFQFVGS